LCQVGYKTLIKSIALLSIWVIQCKITFPHIVLWNRLLDLVIHSSTSWLARDITHFT